MGDQLVVAVLSRQAWLAAAQTGATLGGWWVCVHPSRLRSWLTSGVNRSFSTPWISSLPGAAPTYTAGARAAFCCAGMAEIEEQHPNDPSIALLCTQLWNMQQEQGSYAAALEQARRAYELMLGECGWQPVWLAASVHTWWDTNTVIVLGMGAALQRWSRHGAHSAIAKLDWTVGLDPLCLIRFSLVLRCPSSRQATLGRTALMQRSTASAWASPSSVSLAGQLAGCAPV